MYMINTVVSTDGLEPPITEPSLLCYRLHYVPKKLPALTSKESKKVSNNLQIIIYENTLVAAAGVEPATFAL